MSGQVLAADQLTIVAWGGAAQAAQRQAFFEPFAAKTGTKITEGEYNGEIAKIRAMVETKNVTWDVVDVITQTALAGCSEGIFETIDWSKIGVDRTKLFGGDLQECAVPMLIYAVVLAYDTTKLNPAPTKITDLFDTKTFPGKRALQKDPAVNLEWALLADGVPMKDVYKVLATDEGVERAFKKLDTIKKDVIWWEAGSQGPQLLADGQVIMATSYNGRFYDAVKKDKKPFKVMWDAQAFDWDWWAIPKGSPNLDAAYKFVNFATQAGPQADLTKYISYGPANKDATPNIDPGVLPDLPTAPANMGNVLVLDPQFWADHGEQLRQRFNAWLAQ
ncbi:MULTISPECIES: ABC transporter substrate-binding protein [Mesorhizobium]|uniref:ABC transporter substrate-binding protein n=1 Tax=Mesorhizobium TaxID=68287 RepID=UPI0003CF4404|nr:MULTISPECIES: ABC transporter substrate-binding protein [Mesorhizobium]ESY64041.1 spermidine/putrescine ABC transporter substrate-binding protein [Mesorhizobium sp. LNHC232B00]WJI35752.1 ABC transporter substrate-binding protein [Mesorhizobium opportunistum]